jgi:hypothetical protein
MFGHCPVETVDIDPESDPTICMNILNWTSEDSSKLTKKYAGRRPILCASPPCEEYSQAKTVGERDLATADQNVDKIREIAEQLDPVFIMVENPDTGLLPGRPVIAFMPHRYVVDYCQYGMLYTKPTSIWTSHPLPSFEPRKCPHDKQCQGCMYDTSSGRWRHVDRVNLNRLEDKIRVPSQLIVCIVRAAMDHIVESIGSSAKKRRRDSREERTQANCEVNYILDGRKDENGRLFVHVSWKGYDSTTWEPVENLSAPLETYDFFSANIRKKVYGLAIT